MGSKYTIWCALRILYYTPWRGVSLKTTSHPANPNRNGGFQRTIPGHLVPEESPIYQGTMPDSSSFGFIPGVGISGYAYRHHGTISEVDVHLIEFHPGE